MCMVQLPDGPGDGFRLPFVPVSVLLGAAAD